MIDYLSDEEKEKIVRFNEDTKLVEAVRKVMLAGLYKAGTLREGLGADPLKNGALTLAFATLNVRAALTDEQLGQDIRALAHGLNALETAFQELNKIKLDLGETKPESNEAI